MTNGRSDLVMRRSVSRAGLIAIGGGLAFSAYAWYGTRFQEWIAPAGRIACVVVGILISIWGLKEILLAAFPRLRSIHRGTRYQHRMSVPKEGVLYLNIMSAILIGAMIGRSNLLLLVFSMMAAPFILNGWIIFSMLQRLSVKRVLPRSVMAGQPVAVEIQLTNGKAWIPAWLMGVHDIIENRFEKLAASVLFTRLPGGTRRSARYRMRLTQRGEYACGPLRIATRFPLGLVERAVEVADFDTILVHPQVGQLTREWRRQELIAHELVQSHRTRRGVFDDELNHLREYRSGDNPRSIHWRTSARRGDLMVREFHQSRELDLAIYLDLWQDADRNARLRRDERVELAVSFAATIALNHLQAHRTSDLRVVVAGLRFETWFGQAGPASVDALMDMLALVEANTGEMSDRLLDDASHQNPAKARVVVISTRPGIGSRPLPLARVTDKGANDRNGESEAARSAVAAWQVFEADPAKLSTYFVCEDVSFADGVKRLSGREVA
mgnify:CR=1 FL=1